MGLHPFLLVLIIHHYAEYKLISGEPFSLSNLKVQPGFPYICCLFEPWTFEDYHTALSSQSHNSYPRTVNSPIKPLILSN